MSQFDDLFKRIDDNLNPKDQIKKTNYNLFENRMAKAYGMITESLDSFLNIIERPVHKDAHPVIEYLKTVGPADIEDWVSALEIAVVEREVINRWTLALAEKTQRELNLPSNLRPHMAGILEALNAAPWSEQPEDPTRPVEPQEPPPAPGEPNFEDDETV